MSVEGNRITHDNIVLRELEIQSGEPLRWGKVEEKPAPEPPLERRPGSPDVAVRR